MLSITTAGTCQDRSQSASASTSFFVVPKLRVSLARRAGSLSDGTRIVAAIPDPYEQACPTATDWSGRPESCYGSAFGTAGAAPYRREKWRRYRP